MPLIDRRSRDVSTSGEGVSSGAEPRQTTRSLQDRRRRRSRRRRIYRRIALVLAVPSILLTYSYVSALTGPGSDSVSARSVEWMRGHHLGGIVDSVERRWYDGHQAKVGGTPGVSAARPRVAGATSTTSASATSSATSSTVSSTVSTSADTASTSAGPTPSTGPQTSPAAPAPAPSTAAAPSAEGGLPAPAPLQSPAATPVADEGTWTPIGAASAVAGGSTGAYGTLIRPDAVHTSVLDAVVWIDPHVLRLRQYPGAKVPGAPWDRPDHVEADRQQLLVAAFEGGFRIADSHGGMILGGTELAPMRTGAATLVIDANGVPDVGVWGRDIDSATPYDSARQNLDLIVEGGAPVLRLLQDPNRTWGFTGPANKSAVWRSGAGITADGALVWVGGPGFTIQALAETLVRAGAIRGMQLDINHEWVQLDTYAADAAGHVAGTKIIPEMQHTGDRWLTEDTRDFIAVFRRTGAA